MPWLNIIITGSPSDDGMREIKSNGGNRIIEIWTNDDVPFSIVFAKGERVF